MDFSSGGKRLSGFLKWWLLAEWIIREVVIRKVEMIRRSLQTGARAPAPSELSDETYRKNYHLIH